MSIPSDPATVYTLEPLNYNRYETTRYSLQGALCEAPNTCVQVHYPAALDSSHVDGVFGEYGSIADGAAALDRALTNDPGAKVVMSRSQGSQAAGFWLRNYAPTTKVDRGSISLLLLADPENTYGVPWTPKVPTNTGFDVTELWIQYDGWADFPQRWYPLAVANAVYGMFSIHSKGYMDIDPDDPAMIEWSANGINYKMVPTQELPLLDPLRAVGLGWVADILNDPLQRRVEAAYDRPSSQEQADAQFATQETGDDASVRDESHNTAEVSVPTAAGTEHASGVEGAAIAMATAEANEPPEQEAAAKTEADADTTDGERNGKTDTASTVEETDPIGRESHANAADQDQEGDADTDRDHSVESAAASGISEQEAAATSAADDAATPASANTAEGDGDADTGAASDDRHSRGRHKRAHNGAIERSQNTGRTSGTKAHHH